MLSVELRNNLEEERSLANDLRYGMKTEETIVETFNRYFGTEFRNTKEIYNTPYYKYDFENADKSICIELKSRRNRYDEYPTTIIPVSKVLTITGRYIFVFKFTDGTYYIDYNKEKFSKYSIRLISTYRKGIVDAPKPHFCINITDLVKIN